MALSLCNWSIFGYSFQFFVEQGYLHTILIGHPTQGNTVKHVAIGKIHQAEYEIAGVTLADSCSAPVVTRLFYHRFE